MLDIPEMGEDKYAVTLKGHRSSMAAFLCQLMGGNWGKVGSGFAWLGLRNRIAMLQFGIILRGNSNHSVLPRDQPQHFLHLLVALLQQKVRVAAVTLHSEDEVARLGLADVAVGEFGYV